MVLDPNGLPAIPGSSIAGVLRSAFRAGGNETLENLIFGFQSPAGTERGMRQGSRLNVSWARIHDRHNRPVCELRESISEDDPVLRDALHPTLRDHVRINPRGVAANQGKFDEFVVSAGHRFTFELEFLARHHGEGRAEDEEAWERLLGLLSHPDTRFGGKTRRGLGKFSVKKCLTRTLELGDDEDFAAYLNHNANLEETPKNWEEKKTFGIDFEPLAELRLQPRFFWMFGGGADPDADMTPVRDSRIDWSGETGKPETLYYLPGSGIKGALRHRTLFHACRLAEVWAGDPEDKIDGIEAEVDELFGFEKKDETGQRGHVFIDDIYLPEHKIPEEAESFLPQPHLQHHVSIDRFTGGARESLLFNEKPLFRGKPITIAVHLAKDAPSHDHLAVRALSCALDDLENGRLALGGGVGRGLGFFEPASEPETSSTTA